MGSQQAPLLQKHYAQSMRSQQAPPEVVAVKGSHGHDAVVAEVTVGHGAPAPTRWSHGCSKLNAL